MFFQSGTQRVVSFHVSKMWIFLTTLIYLHIYPSIKFFYVDCVFVRFCELNMIFICCVVGHKLLFAQSNADPLVKLWDGQGKPFLKSLTIFLSILTCLPKIQKL